MRIIKAWGVYAENPIGADTIIAIFTTREEAVLYCYRPNHIVRRIRLPE